MSYQPCIKWDFLCNALGMKKPLWKKQLLQGKCPIKFIRKEALNRIQDTAIGWGGGSRVFLSYYVLSTPLHGGMRRSHLSPPVAAETYDTHAIGLSSRLQSERKDS